ncbi:hypothetical protein K435DRAFT_786479 [Dendrothele bispora CBS 962.96]|uniref:Uncharacterized protein n=1 Tax=Dendrothele bispora (strain CBS 962.96) TaxID=1314807 RepID=A0A4S8KQP6_DENBC|nr:hypothetical protein K435DRAFT_786479 [Dendrothele bispora CBS 962.96]
MSYTIFGRAIKNEYIVLSVISTVAGGAFLATRGSSSKKEIPPASSSVLDKTVDKLKEVGEEVKDKVIKPGMSEEEEIIENIKKYIAEAEKEESRR